jgi:phosphatidylglycerol:prolipoprotein diacylglycerol transferase
MSYYCRRPLEILSLRNGGLAVEGAVIAALIFLQIYSKIKKFNLNEMLDIVALPVPLGQAIGRLGCFLNGCCYGKPTEFFWGVRFPYLSEKVHPTQLYYLITYLALFFILGVLYKKRLKPGIVFTSYILGFALIRYIIDILRGDLLPTGLGLYPTQIIGIALFVAGSISLFSILGKKDKS